MGRRWGSGWWAFGLCLAAAPAFAASVSDLRDLLERHCAECHDENRGRPKAGFGYILDLPELTSDPYYIVPGEPMQSELYMIVEADLMPKGRPPLRPEEKELIRAWIKAGAPTTLETTFETAPMQEVPALQEVEGPAPFRTRFIHWIGNYHPVAVHFPIGLILAAVLAEALGLFTRQTWFYDASRYCIATGALGAVAALTLGFADSLDYVGSEKVLEIHESLGIAATVCAWVAFVFSEVARRRKESAWVVLRQAALLLAAGLVAATGHFGGLLVYGVDHFAW